MPHFIIIARDKPGSAAVRAETRPNHLAYLEKLGDARLVVGPTLDEGGTPTGSVIIAEFADIDAARSFAAHDPYARAGLFESVHVEEWRKVFPG